MSASVPSTTSALPTPSDAADSKHGNGPGNSPLLFFVALGFGVVFANLWIIVGIKYCFRHRRRARARLAAAQEQDADPGVDLTTMPRPRRRKEKQLMTIDQVNERFPVMRYDTWRANQAAKGLSTRATVGGVMSVNRRNSLTDVPLECGDTSADVQSDGDDKMQVVTAVRPVAPAIDTTKVDRSLSVDDFDKGDALERCATANSTHPTHIHAGQAPIETDRDDDDGIRIDDSPSEWYGKPGDTCAVCIDTIDDDDFVRGLACGHAFHSSCLDPWLTSRRACCPLCKADYYTPKPRTETESQAATDARAAYPVLAQLGLVNTARLRAERNGEEYAGRGVFGISGPAHWFSRNRTPTSDLERQTPPSISRSTGEASRMPPARAGSSVSEPAEARRTRSHRLSLLANPFKARSATRAPPANRGTPELNVTQPDPAA